MVSEVKCSKSHTRQAKNRRINSLKQGRLRSERKEKQADKTQNEHM